MGMGSHGISLAAQLGTLPLVVYYFHQVPVYALITNLVAIPLLSCIIAFLLFHGPLMAIRNSGAESLYRLMVFSGT